MKENTNEKNTKNPDTSVIDLKEFVKKTVESGSSVYEAEENIFNCLSELKEKMLQEALKSQHK